MRVVGPLAPPLHVVVALPSIDSNSPEARKEMRRVVLERFPDHSEWPEIHIRIIRFVTFAESYRFMGDDGCMDVEFLFWVIQEPESADLVQAARWVSYRTTNPSRLNIWLSRVTPLPGFC
ncbi:hypothetical protein D1007_45378 [Hordeum vulgare]|nr:hypothetical protein D1007_45378 [Hordeum vulgare]